MQISRGVSMFMMAAPILLIGTVGATAQLGAPKWITPEYGPQVHRDLLAYVPIIQAVNALQPAPGVTLADSNKDVHPALNLWLQGARTHQLKPIMPAGAGDGGADGVRYEIVQSKDRLLMATIRQADKELASGNWADAYQLLSGAIEVSNNGKYMSVPSTEWTAQTQRRIVTELTKMLKTATPEQMDQVMASVSTIDIRPSLIKAATDKQAAYASATDQKSAHKALDAVYTAASNGSKLIDMQHSANNLHLGQVDIARQVLMALKEETLLQKQVESLKKANPSEARLLAMAPATDHVN